MVACLDGPAEFGSLPAEAAEGVRFIEAFIEAREKARARAFGRRMAPDPIINLIMRRMILMFAQSQTKPIAYYQAAGAGLGSANQVRAKLLEMENASALKLVRNPNRPRQWLVVPTARTIDLYAREMLLFRDKAAAYLCADQPAVRVPFR